MSASVVLSSAKDLKKISNEIVKREYEFKSSALYKEIIDFIKFHEGFRSLPYDDAGYQAIGYGQRVIYIKGDLKEKINNGYQISKYEADSVLDKSFKEHMRIVKYNYPELKKHQLYAIAHLSYSWGLGTAMKANVLVNVDGKWEIDTVQLFYYRKVDREKENYKINRRKEYEWFYMM